ncbi:MAG: ferritin family protein [Syntrophomonadaceae bacterium]|jgi:rubrerythrin
MNIREALELAIEQETLARERYLELARIAEDQETRLMLEQIAREEDSHYKRLLERLKAIKLMDR